MGARSDRGDEWPIGAMPVDLGEWVAPEELATLVEEAVDSVSGTGRRACGARETAEGRVTRTLIGVLTYAYARGLFASGDVLIGVKQGELGRWIPSEQIVEVGMLRECRRRCREEVSAALREVTAKVWIGRSKCSGNSYWGLSLGRWREAPPRPDFGMEAQWRVDRAAQADSMELDD